MAKKERPNLQPIIDRHRAAFKRFMRARGLTATSWEKKSGINESTIRAYTSGGGNKGSNSFTAAILGTLAESIDVPISEILGEKIPTRVEVDPKALLEFSAKIISFYEEVGEKPNEKMVKFLYKQILEKN